jgi:alanine racemase
MTVKQVKTGDYIGYGNVAMAETDMKIAIVPVGYAHGFSRSLSNQGRVLIKGLRLNIIGMVNMNMIIIDATNLPDVKKGDEVVLIGEQGDLSISVASFSDMSDQLNYELLTRLPHDIPRIITK